MRKGIKRIPLVFGLFHSTLAFSQPGFSGPNCVLPGVIYQYKIVDASALTVQLNTQVCIHGGSIVDKNGNRLGDCTQSTEPLATILVMWNDTTSGSVAISTSEGNKTLNVNITSELQAGLVDSLTKEQNFSDTTTIPSTIICSAAKGGSCSPNYSYQWQQSSDAMVWTDVQGSTGQNLSFTSGVKQSLYYRRKITETNSGTIGYSDIAIVSVLPIQQTDSSSIRDFTSQQARGDLFNLECSRPDDQTSVSKGLNVFGIRSIVN
jgi:hypothetical protein